MNDEVIKNAFLQRQESGARIARLEESIAKTKRQLLEIDNFIRLWERYSGRSVEELVKEDPSVAEANLGFAISTGFKKNKTKNPKKEQVAKVVVDILQETGTPLSRSALFQKLTERGITLGGSNPEMVLSTMLWRTKDAFNILRLKSGGYALRDKIQHDAD